MSSSDRDPERVDCARKELDSLLEENDSLFEEARAREEDLDRNQSIYESLGEAGDFETRRTAKKNLADMDESTRAEHVAQATEERHQTYKRFKETSDKIGGYCERSERVFREAVHLVPQVQAIAGALEDTINKHRPEEIYWPVETQRLLIEVKGLTLKLMAELEDPAPTTEIGESSSANDDVEQKNDSSLSGTDGDVLELVGLENFKIRTNPEIWKDFKNYDQGRRLKGLVTIFNVAHRDRKTMPEKVRNALKRIRKKLSLPSSAEVREKRRPG